MALLPWASSWRDRPERLGLHWPAPMNLHCWGAFSSEGADADLAPHADQLEAGAVGVATGAVAGLVAITPAAGYVSPLAAVLIGFAAAVVCNGALQLKNRLGLDDTLDVLPVHGVAGLLGTLLTGVFALRVLNPAGADGLITGRFGQLWVQIQAAGFTILWVGVGTYAVLKAIGAFVPLRLTDAQERQGADIHAHGEEAYNSEFTS